MTPRETLEVAQSKGVKMVDLKFMDLPGTWQHFGIPIQQLTEDSFEEGFGFDGSSIRGWQPIHGSERGAGNTYATAMSLLALCIEYGYLPIYQR